MDIINARVPEYKALQQISIDSGGIIQKIMPMYVAGKPSADKEVVDVNGDWVSLGGVDLQINGALGLAFPDLNADNKDKLPEICKFMWDRGVDGFLPTLVTTSVEKIQRSLSVLANFIVTQLNDRPTAQILGVHLEGPFLNPEKRGAHPSEYLLPLTIDNVKRVLGAYADIVKVITLAPELDLTGEVIPYLRSLGIIISLGHSQATADQAQKAFKLGASMVTHAFNAMPSLHHREPGLLGAAIVDRDVKCGLIADGQHVSPTMLQILLQASSYERGIFLVSDALAPLGLPDGVYPWDIREIEVKNGTARLPDGTLSGTTLSLLVGVQNLVKWGICDREEAIALATVAPRKAIGIKGIIGKPAAQLLRWQITQPEPNDEPILTWERLFS
ncbi:N-acetylglucosamine-6-phosphate deacetylase [Argonema antarcticum]|uniref:N-acetylglucosamine-6-phosphate deacetylase n=1 Tax=Argonema antarcticum TaxID=2942763 RepID=UPI002012BA2D|nr:N-acetylglucosamine-6-phosphate deacetylase [Argonema antarcticum]MCL1474763.1 N-acetylglucosamine-6-phosphate deacetylase [Argonema antarcticum A004/B2]